MKFTFGCLVLGVLVATGGCVEDAAVAVVPAHPRLTINDTVLQRVVKDIKTDSTFAALYAQTKSNADAAIPSPTISSPNCTVAGACRGPWFTGYISTDDVSSNVPLQAFVHRVEAALAGADPATPSKYSDRAVKGMLAAAALPSWQWPVGQALEHSAISSGMAYGIDWLYSTLTPAQKATVVNATVELGLMEHARSFRASMWWTRDIYNWVLVSNGGMVVTALALADEPGVAALAADVQDLCLHAMDGAMKSWAPHGIWPEGCGYEGYALEFVVKAASALESATGSSAGLLDYHGLDNAGVYALTSLGPSGKFFDWGDSHASGYSPSTLFFLGDRYHLPAVSYYARTTANADPLTLAFYSNAGSPDDVKALPLTRVWADPSNDTAYGRKTHLGFMRSSWLNDTAAWVAVKGGQNHFNDHGSDSHNNHGHLDVGQFVFEMFGNRWGVDLGGGQYDFPLISYFGRFRFSYYVTSSLGHNVLRFDGETQSRMGSGAITAHDAASVTVDVTEAYGGATSVQRKVSFNDAFSRLTIADSWTLATAKTATWVMHTFATVAVAANGKSAVLTQAGVDRSVRLTVSSPDADARLVAASLDLPFPQLSTVDGKPVTVVTVDVAADAGSVQVEFSGA